jgi:hypothetical protein
MGTAPAAEGQQRRAVYLIVLQSQLCEVLTVLQEQEEEEEERR